ncbi:hypothetical protein COY52_11015 [Candidatus Desantisbacteria bacterium CG_4_10_14_0_8_um_filter_48_22]|uniref:Uncharacterized protein n=1 Tax=Candidatus Desantisbacteria bacterium CG_4_10_14_0_8_um_filter_48_22 TaxID=1974543 RepID=A0A2M7S5K3_9BACT|nr:MAG: hypothetical protein COS16_01370 [Candidatus Desantisbacteria bacterium CG02_land_8_20_14_3_00_49_13]PIZ14790.1 MAG: hypothetical protein COY52_11015 [Candidatus Desantisbacteria bacterium CG_4_10_14_0_8_um_filter_48_22]
MGMGNFIGNFVKRLTVKEIVKKLPNASKENLVALAKIAEKIASLPEDKEKAKIVGEMFQNDHPSLIYAKKILGKLAPNCRDKFAVNLMVNHLLINNGVREKFRRKEIQC